MAPIWPFKKKTEVAVLDEEPPATIVYKKGEDPNARETKQGVDAEAYKDALALFGDGSSTVEAASDQSVLYDGVTSPTQQLEQKSSAPNGVKLNPSEKPEWVHHTDGYHYKKLSDGSFEATPHVKQGDGTYVPYS